MSTLSNKLKSLPKPLLVFHLTFLVVLVMNFVPGRFFLGWDSVTPELNFGLNFKRAFTAAWQENYGLGAMTGHGFAATLPHTLITYAISLLIPQWAIRQIFTLLCYYLGGLGIYFLAAYLLRSGQSYRRISAYSGWISLAAAFYYLFNLGTIQQFYVQLEAFIIHFAGLPWLILLAARLLRRTSGKKDWFVFAAANFFVSGQGFIPPLFINFMFTLLAFMLGYLIYSPEKKKVLAKGAIIVMLTLAINSYWLLPFGYFSLSKQGDYLRSYNNLTSTGQFVEKSKKYGDIDSTALLKSFYWEAEYFGNPLLAPWIKHYSNNLILITGYLLAIGTLMGAIICYKKRGQPYMLSLLFTGLFFLTGLAANVPPFSAILELLRESMPSFYQAFRIAFTKFSIGMAFSYSTLIGICLAGIISLSKNLMIRKAAVAATLFTILSLGWPAIKGNLLYKQQFLKLPQAYLDVINFFNSQPDGRIADFPQDCPEGWFNYKWGYFGSGFYWYGIKQPILARTFDVWNSNNENYYWQISQAIQQKDYKQFENVLRQYKADWLIYDTNAINCRSQKAVFNQEDLFDYISQSADFELAGNFEASGISPIKIYRFKNAVSGYVNASDLLPKTSEKTGYRDSDFMYSSYGDYRADNRIQAYFPFENIMGRRPASNSLTDIKDNGNAIEIIAKIPGALDNFVLKTRSLLESRTFIPITITSTPSGDKFRTDVIAALPSIYINNRLISAPEMRETLGTFAARLDNLSVTVNGAKITTDNNQIRAFVDPTMDNVIEIADNGISLKIWHSRESQVFNDLNLPLTTGISVTKGKKEIKLVFDKKSWLMQEINNNFDIGNCDNELAGKNSYSYLSDGSIRYARLFSQNSNQCINFSLNNLETDKSYLIMTNNRRIQGTRPTLFASNQESTIISGYPLLASGDWQNNYILLSSTIPNGLGYKISIHNWSFTSIPSINDFSYLKIYQLPLNFIKTIEVDNSTYTFNSVNKRENIEYIHPLETFYRLNPDNNKNIILNQQFSPEWLAYYVDNRSNGLWQNIKESLPFIFGTKIANHFQVNGWANGWTLRPEDFPSQGDIIIQNQLSRSDSDKSANTNIVIIFWPQYLEYIGFIILLLTFIAILRYKTKSSNNR